jgi:cobalt-zinc-cadmium efflux system outer membrane protein
MNTLQRIVVSIFTLVLVCSSLQAQESRITVRDALDIAFRNNPELNRASEQINIEKSYQGRALGIRSPEVYYYKEGISDNLFSEQSWGVSQSIAFPLTGYYQRKKVSSDIDVAEMNLNAVEIDIRASVKLAYAELAYAIKRVELIEREVELAEELRQTADARLEAGESTELDLIQAEIQLAQSQNALKEAERLKNDARYALFRLIGLNPDEQMYGVVYPDTLAYVDIQISQRQVLDEMEDHPENRVRELMVESSNREINAAKSRFLPDIRFDFYRQDFGNGYDFNGFNVGLTIPLWFGFNEGQSIQRAKAVRNQAEWSRIESDLILKESAEKAWHGYEASRQKIQAHIEVIESRSAMLLELTREGYRMGELDLLRLLEAQRTYLQGQQVFYQTLKDYYVQLIELERFLPNEIVFTD